MRGLLVATLVTVMLTCCGTPSTPDAPDASVPDAGSHLVHCVVESSTFVCPLDMATVLVSMTTDHDFQAIFGAVYNTPSGCIPNFDNVGADLNATFGDEVTLNVGIAAGASFGCPPESLSPHIGCSDLVNTIMLACEER